MISAIILEDEKNVASNMKRLLDRYQNDIRVAGVCFSVKEAELLLQTVEPDLMFLDIELGKSQTCFDLLKRIAPVNFGIVFTTAYGRSAIQALKISGIDFLLKPVDEKELERVVAKFRDGKFKQNYDRIDSLLNAWHNPGNQQNKLHVHTPLGYKQVTIANIVYAETFNGNTFLVLNNNERVAANISLKECEDILTTYRFHRIHRSYLVNLNHVRRYINGKKGVTLMSNDANLDTSRSMKDIFLRKLEIG